jgi:O-antigen/teichoic acid export membrane protein
MIGARNAVVLTQAIVYLVATGILLLLGVGAAALVVGSIVSYVLSGALAARHLSFVAPLAAMRVTRTDVRRYAAFGARGQVGQLAQYLNYRLDALILGALTGSGAVGVYAVATSLAEVVSQVSNASATVAFGELARVDGEPTIVARLVRTVLAAAIGTAVLTGIGGVMAIPVVFGDRFAESTAPFLILLPGVVALSVVKMLSAAFVASGNPGRMTIATLVSLGLTITLDIALVPTLGAVGAAIASTAAYAAGAIACVWIQQRSHPGPLALLLVARREDFALPGRRS